MYKRQAAHRTGVRRGHDRGQVLHPALGGLRLLPGPVGTLLLDGDAPEHGGQGDTGGEGQDAGPAAQDGREQPRAPLGRPPGVREQRGQLPYGVDAVQHGFLHARGRGQGGRAGQAGGGGGEFGDVLPAGGAVGEVGGEGLGLGLREGVEGVRAGEGVQFTVVLHVVTPMQSRSRMSPSRMRVLMVGSGVHRVSATSR